MFQTQVRKWVEAAFGVDVADNREERSQRFIEEALELVQSAGMTKTDVLLLVDYVFSRPKGTLRQEFGGTVTTLNAMASAHRLNLEQMAYDALQSMWERIDKIREKQKTKPRNSPLPGPSVDN
jgi:hypothetical protein